MVPTSRVSCQKGHICYAYAWRVGPFWQDTIDIAKTVGSTSIRHPSNDRHVIAFNLRVVAIQVWPLKPCLSALTTSLCAPCGQVFLTWVNMHLQRWSFSVTYFTIEYNWCTHYDKIWSLGLGRLTSDMISVCVCDVELDDCDMFVEGSLWNNNAYNHNWCHRYCWVVLEIHGVSYDKNIGHWDILLRSLSPVGHAFRTAWETTIKSPDIAKWFLYAIWQVFI